MTGKMEVTSKTEMSGLTTLKEGVTVAAQSIDSGSAARKLDDLVDLSQKLE